MRRVSLQTIALHEVVGSIAGAAYLACLGFFKEVEM